MTRSNALLLWKNSLMKYLLLHKIFMDLFGLVFWPQDISPLLYPGPVVHPQEFGSHSFCPRALFLPAPCQYFSINASEQMSIFLLLNLYLLLASNSGKVQEQGSDIWWYELHIENDGFHDYHAHPSYAIYGHSRINIVFAFLIALWELHSYAYKYKELTSSIFQSLSVLLSYTD